MPSPSRCSQRSWPPTRSGCAASSRARRADLRATTVGRGAIHSGTTEAPEGTQTTGKSDVHPTSSAEYIVGEVKTHKFAAFAALSALFVALAVGGYYLSALRSSATITSVAVLPFDGRGDQNLEYLSDGLSESVIDRLSGLPQLKVIARSSSFQ